MPTLSEFFGITIRMFWMDHARPHFHAEYSGEKAIFQIGPFKRVRGRISKRVERLIREWTKLHREELLFNWELLSAGQREVKIPGLE